MLQESSTSVNTEQLHEKSVIFFNQEHRIPTPVNKVDSTRNSQMRESSIMSVLEVDKNNSVVKKILENNIIPEESFSNRSDSEIPDQLDKFDIHDIPNVPKTTFDKAKLGKQALATLNKEQSLTYQKLEKIHGSLMSRPTEDQEENDPRGLEINLMPHQKHALAWMKWRERQEPKGGILGRYFCCSSIYLLIYLLKSIALHTSKCCNSKTEYI